MKKWTQLLVLAMIGAAVVVSFASTSEAAAVKLRKVSRITAPHEETTQVLIKSLKSKIESDCRALSKSDTLEVVNEKVVEAAGYGRRDTLRALNLTLVRKSGGQRYYIRAATRWDIDPPAPRVEIQLDSRFCR